MKRRIYDLGVFHREATRRGLTYAEAQIQESCEMIGSVRVPRNEGAMVYQKMSAWKIMGRLKRK